MYKRLTFSYVYVGLFKVTVSPVGVAAPEAPVTGGEEVLKEAEAVEFVPSYSFVK